MTSFNRAMSGLQSRTRENTQFQIQDNTAAAEREGRAAIKRASDVAGKLSEFSGMLKDWKVQDIKNIGTNVADTNLLNNSLVKGSTQTVNLGKKADFVTGSNVKNEAVWFHARI